VVHYGSFPGGFIDDFDPSYTATVRGPLQHEPDTGVGAAVEPGEQRLSTAICLRTSAFESRPRFSSLITWTQMNLRRRCERCYDSCFVLRFGIYWPPRRFSLSRSREEGQPGVRAFIGEAKQPGQMASRSLAAIPAQGVRQPREQTAVYVIMDCNAREHGVSGLRRSSNRQAEPTRELPVEAPPGMWLG
jgi:hypothetical protein